jgi:hypothetical protein
MLVAVVHIVATWDMLYQLIGPQARRPFYWCLDCQQMARNLKIESEHDRLAQTLAYSICGYQVSNSTNLKTVRSSSTGRLSGVDSSK